MAEDGILRHRLDCECVRSIVDAVEVLGLGAACRTCVFDSYFRRTMVHRLADPVDPGDRLPIRTDPFLVAPHGQFGRIREYAA